MSSAEYYPFKVSLFYFLFFSPESILVELVLMLDHFILYLNR